jgi:hypothetical protein
MKIPPPEVLQILKKIYHNECSPLPIDEQSPWNDFVNVVEAVAEDNITIEQMHYVMADSDGIVSKNWQNLLAQTIEKLQILQLVCKVYSPNYVIKLEELGF